MAALDSDIEVLEDRVILGTSILGQPSNETALEVKDAVHLLLIATYQLLSVRHHYQVDWDYILEAHGEDTIDSCKKCAFPLLGLNVLLVVLKHPLEGGKLAVIHGLDDESLVLAEEEEAATLALRLSRPLDGLQVVLRLQGFDDVPRGDTLEFSQITEDTPRMLIDSHRFVDHLKLRLIVSLTKEFLILLIQRYLTLIDDSIAFSLAPLVDGVED